MKVGLAIYNILSNDSDITDIVSTRIFPNVAPQTTTFPFIIYDVDGDTPTDTKDGASSLDINSLMVSCYCETYTQACDLAQLIRTALDRISESTYNTITIQSSEYRGYSDIFDDDAGDNGIYRKAIDFDIRVINAKWRNSYSLEFDGVDDYVTMADTTSFSFGDGSSDDAFSFSLWLDAVDITSTGLIAKDASSNSEYHILVSSGDYLRFRLYDNSTSAWIQTQIDSTVTSWQGSWKHLVCTYSGNSSSSGLKIYVDGSVATQTATNSGTYTAMENTSAALNMGRSERSAFYFDGKIDEVSLWNKELSSAEVTSLYNSGSPTYISSNTGLIGWWRNGDGATYPTIPDDSTNSNNGTMTNMASGDIQGNVPS